VSWVWLGCHNHAKPTSTMSPAIIRGPNALSMTNKQGSSALSLPNLHTWV